MSQANKEGSRESALTKVRNAGQRFWTVVLSSWKPVILLAVALILVLGVSLIVRIVTAPVSIGAPATESDALVRSSERLIQMVHWTISTVLIIGGGLLGLNWYLNESRYKDDRAKTDERIERLMKGRLADVESSMANRLDLHRQLGELRVEAFQTRSQITQMLMFPGGAFPEGGLARRVTTMLEQGTDTQSFQREAIQTVLNSLENLSLFSAFIVGDGVPGLIDAARKRGFEEEATRLTERYAALQQKLKDERSAGE